MLDRISGERLDKEMVSCWEELWSVPVPVPVPVPIEGKEWLDLWKLFTQLL